MHVDNCQIAVDALYFIRIGFADDTWRYSQIITVLCKERKDVKMNMQLKAFIFGIASKLIIVTPISSVAGKSIM
jgi:hypothetical protein